jgi:hypothetical protein
MQRLSAVTVGILPGRVLKPRLVPIAKLSDKKSRLTMLHWVAEPSAASSSDLTLA